MQAKELRYLIKKKYGIVRKFSHEAGLTESMMSHILHKRKKIHPQSVDNFARLLEVDRI